MAAQETKFGMIARKPRRAAANEKPAPKSIEDRIRAFLAGETNGEELFRALYDHVLDEPIPERLRALLRLT